MGGKGYIHITNNGKIKCTAKNTKKGLNKSNIWDNLSKFITDENGVLVDENSVNNNLKTVTFSNYLPYLCTCKC